MEVNRTLEQELKRAVDGIAADAPEVAPAAVDGLPEVWALVRALPSKQRTAIALRFVAGSSHAEIAAVMDCSEEAARRNVHEGLKRLRKEYRDGCE